MQHESLTLNQFMGEENGFKVEVVAGLCGFTVNNNYVNAGGNFYAS